MTRKGTGVMREGHWVRRVDQEREARGTPRIAKLLVANRGEIARRIMRSCRDLGIATVAVTSDADRDAPFVREADEAVAIGGVTPAESYLRSELLVAAARRTGADAVHPGYGFLAEDAAFAAACRDAGLTFVGPTPEVIARMGSKLEAKLVAQAVGVPVLAAAPAPADVTEAELAARAREIGFPILVKASAGGGGRGMRQVRREEELARAVAAARREAGRAFGDDTIFLEPWLEGVRHVEVQIVGDAHGDVVHLFERECSVQRRHQKIIEESPSPAVDPALRLRLTDAAVALGRALGYQSAGTVEFLLADDGRFFLLEVNTRLQVEHPVTEAITGLDLVALQIRIAEGRPLPAEVRSASARGHAIEARLCAEDPERDLLPSSGRVARFRLEPSERIRVDAGIEDGSEVSPYYDSMLAKVIAHAPTREEAIRSLRGALGRLRLHGVRHNRDLLLAVLGHPDFVAGRADTGFLVAHAPVELARSARDPGADRIHALAAALAAQAERRAAATVLRTLPSGWRNLPSADQEVAYATPAGARLRVAYSFGRGGLAARIDGEDLGRIDATIAPRSVALEIAGLRRTIEIHSVGDVVFVDSALGGSELREEPRFPAPSVAGGTGSLAAPMPGRVVRVAVREGDRVAAGDELLVLEAMKMEHRIEAPCAGRVAAVHVAAGDFVVAGAVMAVIEPGEEANSS
jgi:acetyl/propionyl-CoA carboxylase alpha subunit